MISEYPNEIAFFLKNVEAEVRGASKKFPTNISQLAAAMEETGEVAKALLDQVQKGAPASDVYDECVQAAAMFARIALEGSGEFPYKYERAFAVMFEPTKP